jgi:hypothetical protein
MKGRQARVAFVALFFALFFAVSPLGLTSAAADDEAPAVGRLESSGPAARPPTPGHRHLKPFRHPAGAEVLARSKAVSELTAPTIATTPLAPAASTVVTGFDGVDESSTYADPPDGAIAVSGTYIVEAVNDAMSIWTKSYDAGGNLSAVSTAISAADLNIFFGNNPNCYSAANDFFGLVSDPSLDYDAAHDRFFLSMISFDQLFGVSSLCIAVTATGDPTGSWFIYAFPIPSGFTGSLLDFPRGVVGADGVIYVAGNYFVFDFSGNAIFRNARIYAFKTADMYLGHNTTPKVVGVGKDPQTGLPADSLTPARGVGVFGMYFVSASNPTAPALGSLVTLWKWSNPFGTSSFTRRGYVTVASYAQPPGATQPGAFPSGVSSCTQTGAQCIQTNDARNLTAYWSNGTVWAAHNVGCTQAVGPVACVQWYQLGNLDGAPALRQQGIVDDETVPGRYRYFPSLAVDSNGKVALAYGYSSATEYPGIAYTTITAGVASFETVLKVGEVTFVSTRYGDYAATTVDPHDHLTIWHIEEYAKNLAGTSEWGTWIGAIRN